MTEFHIENDMVRETHQRTGELIVGFLESGDQLVAGIRSQNVYQATSVRAPNYFTDFDDTHGYFQIARTHCF